jgi:hypothetical protein
MRRQRRTRQLKQWLRAGTGSQRGPTAIDGYGRTGSKGLLNSVESQRCNYHPVGACENRLVATVEFFQLPRAYGPGGKLVNNPVDRGLDNCLAHTGICIDHAESFSAL